MFNIIYFSMIKEPTSLVHYVPLSPNLKMWKSSHRQAHLFESGTLEVLMKTMFENNNSTIGVFDEFSTFVDSIDKGSSGSCERGRYLSLYSGVNWSKTTKSSGSINLKDPRFNLISYTQPHYAVNFTRTSNKDGFFQRFLVTVPHDVFILSHEKTNLNSSITDTMVEMEQVLGNIMDHCYEIPQTKV